MGYEFGNMATSRQDRCEDCNLAFDPFEHRVMNNPWRDLMSLRHFGRGQRNLWRWGYVENTFNLVKCPACSHEQRSDALHIFGVFPSAKSYRGFQLTILAGFLVLLVVVDLW